MLRVAAVDLGATSARVAVVDLDAQPPEPQIVHRYNHRPVIAPDGSLRWDWTRLVAEVEVGLAAALRAGPLASIGVDTWGVDYGLLGRDGALLSTPFCYRDSRTAGWEAVADRLGRERLYRTSGIQLMGINTVFQLAAHDREELAAASTLLLLPELLVWQLTGFTTGEVTSAGTTALVDITTGTWSPELLEDIDVDPGLLPPIAVAGTPAGTWRGIPVRLVGGHDTASAVMARPPGAPAASAFVSAGTWLLVGAERPAPDTSDAARLRNFSNEPGALGGIRFLKNVNGLWLLERCRAEWGSPPLDELFAAASAVRRGGPTFDPNDRRFDEATALDAEIRGAAELSASAGPAEVVRCLLDSLATATAGVVEELGTFLGSPISRIDIVGGGSRVQLLVRLLEELCQVEVVVGSAEATVLGNALVQGVALGNET